MQPFKYSIPSSEVTAIQSIYGNGNAKFLAGGTNLVDLMKEDVERPTELIDLTRLNHSPITTTTNGSVLISSLDHNASTANHPIIRQQFPLLSQAILAGASVQIRNMATNGGNMNQRTRCPYFFETGMPCNKREPGTGCGALEGVNRMHAIFGWSKDCVAVHPSDMCVALVALDAIVHVQGNENSKRVIPFVNYHRLPGLMPQKDNTLAANELVTAIEIPANKFSGNSYYLKVRERSSYAFALVSVAAALEMNGNQIKKVRIAMGGVAHKPWRAMQAEKFLIGKTATEANFKLAADAEMRGAKPLTHNKFKVNLGKNTMIRALVYAMNGGINSQTSMI